MSGRPTVDVIEAARKAELRVWQHYGLTVAERFVEIDHPPLRVRMIECGDPSGQPVIFVQGGLGEAFQYAALMAQLSEFRCISLDRPGGGLSDGIDFLGVDIHAVAVDVLQAVLDTAGIPQAPFVANSMGAWWTLQLALRAPARISRMLLLGCPALLLQTSAPPPFRLVSAPVLGPRMVRLMTPSSPDRARDIPKFLGHPKEVGQHWPDCEAEAHYRFGNLPNFQRSWLTLLKRFLTPWGSRRDMRITEDHLSRVTHPVLLLWGSHDNFGGLKAAREAVTLMRDARLEVVGIGHLPWWDDPKECGRLAREFLLRRQDTRIAND